MFFKLQNKRTGEIGYLYANKNENYNVLDADDKVLAVYPSLVKLNEEWKDYEPVDGWWYINTDDYEVHATNSSLRDVEKDKEIGNYFATKEEAEEAVRKLKALKRLKDKDFKFVGWCDSVSDNNPDMALFRLDEYAWETDTCDDLDILFGG